MSKKKIITLIFDDEKDAKEVFDSLKTKNELTWHVETKQAMIAPDPDKPMTILVSKSINVVPKPIRL